MSTKRNTKLHLLYVDGANYKTSLTVVLAGAITNEQIAAIKPKLDRGIMVIAEQIGLPTPSFNFRGKDGWPSDELDHVFTTLQDFKDFSEVQDGDENLPAAAEMLTDEEPTIGLTLGALVSNILAVDEWDVATEWYRMEWAA